MAKKEERKAAREKAKMMKAIEAHRKQLGKHKENVINRAFLQLGAHLDTLYISL